MSTVNLPRDDVTIQDLKHANANRTPLKPLSESAPGNPTGTANQQPLPRSNTVKRRSERRKKTDRRQQNRRQQHEQVLLDTRNNRERRRCDRRKEKHALKESVKDYKFTARGIDISV